MNNLIKFFLLAWSCLAFWGSAVADKPLNTNYGDVTLAELKMDSYAQDPEAAAVILFDLAKLWHMADVQQNYFQRHIRIKVLNESALDLANYEIAYYGNNWRTAFTKFKATAYNLVNGRIVETSLDKKEVFDQEVSGHHRKIKFAFPEVKAGTVIELHYIEKKPFQDVPDWVFQREYPVAWSEFELSLPAGFRFQPYYQGYIPLLVNQNGLDVSETRKSDTPRAFGKIFTGSGFRYEREFSHWVAQNIPAFDVEDYITAPSDYLTKIKLYLFEASVFERATRQSQQVVTFGGQRSTPYTGTQYVYEGTSRPLSGIEEMHQLLMESEGYGGQFKYAKLLKEDAAKINAAYTQDEERLEAAFDYVQNQIEWNGYLGKHCQQGVKKAWSEGRGNTADVNITLTLLLRQMGYEADPVIIALRDYGKPSPVYPIMEDYQSTVCHVSLDGKSILLDATQRFLPYDQLPNYAMTGKGKLISENKAEEVNLLHGEKESTYLVTQLNIDAQGAVIGDLNHTYKSYAAAGQKRLMAKEGVEGYEASFERFVKGFEVTRFEEQGANSQHSTVLNKAHIISDELVTVAGDKLFYNAVPFGGMASNMLKAESRLYPLDFTAPIDQTMIFQYHMPEGYVAEELPEPVLVRLPDNSASFLFNVVTSGSTIQLTSKLNLNKLFFLPEEYAQLRTFFDQVVAKHAEQIVLSKAN